MHLPAFVGVGFSVLSSAALVAEPFPVPRAISKLSTNPSYADDLESSAAYDRLSRIGKLALEDTFERLAKSYTKRQNGWTSKCTKDNLKVRREWGSLSVVERIAYTDAVKCLQQKPHNSPSSWSPGARSRYDDFIATHINQSLTIHFTGTFLAWHRYFLWHYEQALINECGYNGTQPYWDWAKTARDGVEKSPIFDGSETSMSGDGAPVDGQANVYLGFAPQAIVGPGSGGGCVTGGPFKDYTVNLGPGSLTLPGNKTMTSDDPLAYNPRCLRRSLSQELNTKYANASAIEYTIAQTSIKDFQAVMQGAPGLKDLGIHVGGHYTLGGDPGRDFMVSPGDPMFYLHHGQIDRVWWMWQTIDLENRVYGDNAIAGTNTAFNIPPSANTTFDTVIDLGYASGPPLSMRELMSTTAGPFCYVYE